MNLLEELLPGSHPPSASGGPPAGPAAPPGPSADSEGSVEASKNNNNGNKIKYKRIEPLLLIHFSINFAVFHHTCVTPILFFFYYIVISNLPVKVYIIATGLFITMFCDDV